MRTGTHLTETERKSSPHQAIGHPLQELSILRSCGFPDSVLKAGFTAFYGPAPKSDLEWDRQAAVKLLAKANRGKASDAEIVTLNNLIAKLCKHHLCLPLVSESATAAELGLVDTVEAGYIPVKPFDYAPHSEAQEVTVNGRRTVQWVDGMDATWQQELKRIAQAVGIADWILPEARLVIRPEDTVWRDKGCESDKAVADYLDQVKETLTGLTGEGGSSRHLVPQRVDMLEDCASMELLRMAEHSAKTGAPFGQRQKSDGSRDIWYIPHGGTQLLAEYARQDRRQTAKAVHAVKVPVERCPMCEGAVVESHVYRLRCTQDIIETPIYAEDGIITSYHATPQAGAAWYKTSQAPDRGAHVTCLQWTQTSTNITCSRCHIGIPADYDNHVHNVTDATECPDYHSEVPQWSEGVDSAVGYNHTPIEEIIADPMNVLADVQQSESVREIMDASESLSDKQRRVIELTLLNLPDDDIATALGITAQAVAVNRFRATQKLRLALSPS